MIFININAKYRKEVFSYSNIYKQLKIFLQLIQQFVLSLHLHIFHSNELKPSQVNF